MLFQVHDTNSVHKLFQTSLALFPFTWVDPRGPSPNFDSSIIIKPWLLYICNNHSLGQMVTNADGLKKYIILFCNNLSMT